MTRLLMKCGDVLVQALAAGKVPRTGCAKKWLDVGVLDRVRNQSERVVHYNATDVTRKSCSEVGWNRGIQRPATYVALLVF